jgi:hypothetical protein
MNHAFDVADKTATWRHAAFAAAVAATFALVILPTGALSGVRTTDTDLAC